MKNNSAFAPVSGFCTILIAVLLPPGSEARDSRRDLACDPGGAPVIHVAANAPAGGDGASWSTAYRDLAPALAAARARAGREQIWIAAGTYSAASAYDLPSDVAVLGGFSGHERRANQRNLERNVTTLRADATAFHVLTALSVSNVSIAALTVTGGAAVGALAADTLGAGNEVRGGGLFAIDSHLALCGVTFTGNRASKFGGAIFQHGGTLDIFGSRFSGNSVLRGPAELHDEDSEADTDGGALAIHDAERLRVIDSVLENNLAGDDGGALASRRTNVELIRSRFVRNRGIALIRPVVLGPGVSPHDLLISSMGGAAQIWNEYLGFGAGGQSRTTRIEDCDFLDNAAAIAGAAYIESAPGSTTFIGRSRFMRNGGDGLADPEAPPNERGVTPGRSGGALMIVGLRWGDRETDADGRFVRPQHHLTIDGSLFEENSAGYGGAMQLIGMDGQIAHSVFRANVARQRAGAVLTSNLISLFDQLGGQRPGLGAMRIAHSSFIGNRALGVSENLLNEDFPGLVMDSEQPYGGGALFNEGAYDLEVSDSLFIANSARDSDGGAIHNAAIHVGIFAFASPPAPVSYGASLRVRSSAFLGNEILGDGSGAAIANGGSQRNGTLFDRDEMDARDIAAPAEAHIEDSVFAFNSARHAGGALVNWNGSELLLHDAHLIGNKATFGAGIASVGRPARQARLSVTGSWISGNHAASAGGGIFARDTAGSTASTTVRGNTPQDVDWQ